MSDLVATGVNYSSLFHSFHKTDKFSIDFPSSLSKNIVVISDRNVSFSLQRYNSAVLKIFPESEQNSLTLKIITSDHFLTCGNPDKVLASVNLCKSGINTFVSFQASAHNPGDNQCRSTHPGRANHISNWRSFTTVNCLNLLIAHLYFVEKTLQQDMLDFLQGARGQDFHYITLIVDGEPIGAHKVR